MGAGRHIFFISSLTLMMMDIVTDFQAGWQSIKLYSIQVNNNYMYISQLEDCYDYSSNFNILGQISVF